MGRKIPLGQMTCRKGTKEKKLGKIGSILKTRVQKSKEKESLGGFILVDITE